jgi:pimeloyl-ACP methyl ester carboxylesterase
MLYLVKFVDIEHFYIEKGQGFPIILLHGNGGNNDYFQGQINEFSKKYHVYAIDTRGHGKTPSGEKSLSIRQFAEDLLGFMDKHQIEKANILGFSDGANIAMIFAIQHPKRLNRLILNGANLNTDGIKKTTQIPIEIGYKIASKFANKNENAKLNAEILGLMVNDPNINPQELKKIQAKTLIIVGTNDLIKESHTKLIKNNISDSKLVLIEGNHFIANKKPIEFNKVVLDFLEN